MNRAEYTEWTNTIIDPEDVDKQSELAQEKYLELTAGMSVAVISHDWRETDDHMQAVCKKIKEMDINTMYYFPPFYDFPNGSLDAITTVMFKETINVTGEFAEILADLVVNLGAEGS